LGQRKYIYQAAILLAGERIILSLRGICMSSKFDALMTILNKLDQSEKVTKQSLMDDLEISERSAYRYVQILQNSGFRIKYDRQKQSYAFEDGFSLAKPNVSVEELLAISLAKRMLGAFGTGMEKSLATIESKLSAKQTVLPRHIILKASDQSPKIDSYLGALHQAIMSFQKVEILYQPLHSAEETNRIIDPHYLFFNDGFWYLRGHCRKSKEMRTFALDRIVMLKTLSEHFLPKPVSPEEELATSFGTWLDGEPTEVVLQFDKEIKEQILRKKWHQSQKNKELKNGKIEIRFVVKGLGGIKKWIYQWIPNVKVIAPISLKMEVKRDVGITMQNM